MLQSARAHHPDAHLYCVIVDADESHAAALGNEFQTVSLDEIGLPARHQFIFQYSVLELNTAVKPWAMEALLAKGHEHVVYIDPDIFLYRSLHEVFSAFNDGADIVITPHLVSPMTDDLRPTELDIRRAGTYNFGFCAVKSSDNTLRFIHWWQEKLARGCIVDMDRGIFVDQSWIDLVPGLFDNVSILRSPGYNAAYWNLAQRKITREATGQWVCNNQPLTFFHYSGLNPLNPESFSKHQNRFTLSSLGPVKALVDEYVEILKKNGAESYSKLHYGFGHFNDGARIPDLFRRPYLNSEELRKEMGDNPFEKSDALSWNTKNRPSGGIPITWAMHILWDARIDLQTAFPLTDDSSAYQYWTWFLEDADTYFEEAIVKRHRQIFSSLSQPVESRVHPPFNHFDSAASRTNAIFIHLLGRPPGPRGLAYLTPWCRSKLGAVLTSAAIASTSESRARGNTLKRLKKAWGRILSTPAPQLSAEPSVAAKSVSGDHVFSGYSGIYPPEQDSSTNGLWCSQVVDIPLPSETHQHLMLSGNFMPELHRRASKIDNIEMRILLDETTIHSEVLSDSGMIDLTIPVPTDSSRAKLLRIELSSSFIPSELNLNGDTRTLAWRITKASSDSCTMVDVTRSIQLLPLSALRKVDGINLVGYLAAELGVGEAARTMAKAAHKANIPYSIVDVGFQSSNRQTDKRAWQESKDRVFDIDIIYVNADQTPSTLRYLDDVGHPRPKARIGYWHWEQPKLPEKYLQAFEGLDEIWVPTSFVHHAVASISPIPVFKVPHTVEFNVDSSITRASFGIPENSYAVLVMYDFHSYRYRKNPEAAVTAYRMASKTNGNSCLIIKTINADKYPDDYKTLKESVADLSDVIFLDAVYSRSMIYALEACCDCMISLHRAEGFGLGPAEMMYLGKPVIATGWSGNMEFMNNMNSFPVNYSLKPLEHSVGVYEAGIDWAEPDVEHAAHSLSKLLSDPILGRDVGRRAKATIDTTLNAKVIGSQYRARLALVAARFQ